jgi:hypothetical protein
LRRPRSRPYFPSQTETGATYVVDCRSGKAVAGFRRSFDTTERWKAAVRAADSMNDKFEARFYWRRRVGATLTLAATILVLVLWRVLSFG